MTIYWSGNFARLGVHFVAMCAIVFLVFPSQAQVSGVNAYGADEASGNPLTALQRRLTSSANNTTMMPLEGAVDPNEYIIGPGDQFLISAGRGALSSGPIPVGADGLLPIPESRPVFIAGLTLASAREVLENALADSYGDAVIDIVLFSPRHFYVHVSGAVPTPGKYLTLPVARVSAVLIEAFADTLRSPTSNDHLRPSLRNITVVHKDGTESAVDLPNYFSSGNLDWDPYLRDGDVIIVPAYDPAFSSIYIDGAVPFPGPYDYRTDDTIQNLIAVAGGVDRNSAVDNIRVLRVDEKGNEQIFTFSLEDALLPDGGSFPLEPRDHVSIARKKVLFGAASVDGMVRHPGTYPIEDGVTTLRQFIELAGGLDSDALLRAAYLERRSMPEIFQVNKTKSVLTPAGPAARLLLADSTEILQRVRLTDLNYLSRAYFAQETRLQNRVSVDLEKLMSGDWVTVKLRDGDHLVVPRDDHTVYVFGQVNRAGFVPYVKEKDVNYYIAQAGGRGYGAVDTEPYVIQPGTGTVHRLATHIIESGDMIFLERSGDVADNLELQKLVLETERVKSDAKIRTASVVLQAVTAVASLTALIISLSR